MSLNGRPLAASTTALAGPTIAMSSRPIPRILAPLASIAAPFYGLAVAARNRRFDSRRAPIARLPVPVISIGNITAGGTGKSPMTSWCAALLLAANHRPLIALRGYRATADLPSDEAVEHQRRLPNVPVVTGADRAASITAFLQSSTNRSPSPDCVILDDGFQHRSLARDLDLVLVDASRSPFDDHLLPAGFLREPVAALARADAVIVTHADLPDASRLQQMIESIRRHHGRDPVALFRHAWDSFLIRDPSTTSTHAAPITDRAAPVSTLSNLKVLALAAIGNPEPFLAMVRAHAADIVDTIILRDHADFSPAILRRIQLQAASRRFDAVFTTEKDWSRLEAALSHHPISIPVIRPRLIMSPISGEAALRDRLLQTVRRTS